MDPKTKDWIDLISKLVGFFGVGTAVLTAGWQVRKARIERAEQARKELASRELNTKITQASFWLQLRKMFADHNEVHFNLRPDGAWTKTLAETEFPKVEAYMGLFEHCKLMLDDGLIDINTFKKIYAYRLDNIVNHPIIVFAKLMDCVSGWKEFIGLVQKVDLLRCLLETEKRCLQDPANRAWLADPFYGKWQETMKALGIDVGKILPPAGATAP